MPGRPDPSAVDVLGYEALDRITDVFYLLDDRRELVWWTRQLPAVTGYDDATIAGMSPLEFFPPDAHDRVADAIERVLVGGSTAVVEAPLVAVDGERVPHELTGAPVTDGDGRIVGLAGTARDVTERRARERELARQRARLERLDAANSVVRDVLGLVVRSDSRAALEAGACDRLVRQQSYRHVWLGSPGHAGGGLRTRAAAADGDATAVEAVLDEAAPADPTARDHPVAHAARTDEPAFERGFDPDDDGWRGRLAAAGVRAAVALPVVHERVTYDLLAVHATTADAFDAPERDLLAELCDSLGYAIGSLARRAALTDDDAVEFRFRVAGGDHPFVGLHPGEGSRVEFHAATDVGEGRLRWLVTASGVPAAAIDRTVEVADAVDSIVVLAERDDEVLLSVTVDDPALSRRLADHGARIDSLVARAGEATLTVRAGSDADGGVLSGVVAEFFGSVSLVGRRTVARRALAADRVRALDALTDRQRAVLEAAYRAGYFDPSRRVTGATLADSFGVSRATFHEHLRAAHRNLLGVVFDDA